MKILSMQNKVKIEISNLMETCLEIQKELENGIQNGIRIESNFFFVNEIKL